MLVAVLSSGNDAVSTLSLSLSLKHTHTHTHTHSHTRTRISLQITLQYYEVVTILTFALFVLFALRVFLLFLFLFRLVSSRLKAHAHTNTSVVDLLPGCRGVVLFLSFLRFMICDNPVC